MAPKRNLSLKFCALRKLFSVLFRMFGVRKGTEILSRRKFKNIDYEAPSCSKPCFETAGMHGSKEDEEDALLSGEEDDNAREDAQSNASEDVMSQADTTRKTALAQLLVDKTNKKKTSSYCEIGGNIYRGMSFQLYRCGDCSSRMMIFGALLIFIIQLLAPIFLLGVQIVTIDWSSFGKHTTNADLFDETSRTYVNYVTRGLAGMFFLAICIWAYIHMWKEHDDWSKVYFCWHASSNYETDCCPTYQLIGAFMNQYVVVMNVIITGLMFLTTDNPTDIVLNALALQFLVSLDDFGGGFDFIPELWDPEMVAQVFFDEALAYGLHQDVDFQTRLWEEVELEGDVSSEEKTMQLAFAKGGFCEYPLYYITTFGNYLSSVMIFLAFVAYVITSNRGIEKYPSALERNVPLQNAIANCTHEVCNVLKLQLEIASGR